MTLIDTLVGMLMDLMGFVECIEYVRRIWNEECYNSFVWRRNYMSNTWPKIENVEGNIQNWRERDRN